MQQCIVTYRLLAGGILTELLVHVRANEGDVRVLELERAGLDEAKATTLLKTALEQQIV